MSKSSIHIEPVKSSSEVHNTRKVELDYVRKDLSDLNESFVICTIQERLSFVEENCKSKTGRSMQAKATPIREGVLLVDNHHTIEDLKRLGFRLEKEFGIKTIQAYLHKDEGHYDSDTNTWKPNLHAHLVFDWTDHTTGKSIKLKRQDMSEIQTVVAEELGLERGVSSDVKHLNAISFKIKKEEERLKLIHGISDLKKESKDLKGITDLTRYNLEHLGNKIEKMRLESIDLEKNIKIKKEELEELTKKVEQKRSFGFGR